MTPEDLWAIPRVGAPEPAPDGAALIVPVTRYSLETNEGRTRLHHVAGGTARPLTSADVSSTQPAWSPDGSRLAFVRKHEDSDQLFVMRLDGGEPERLTDLPLGVVDPRWFPDGERIAFLSPVYLDAPTPEATRKRLAKEKDAPRVHVTEDRFYRAWDRWIADGRRHHLFCLDLATREITDLTPTLEGWFDPTEPAGKYAIAPDGKEVAFSVSSSRPPHDPLLWGTFTVKVSRRGRPDRTREITPAGYERGFKPVYSPDGRRILFGVKRSTLSWADRTRLALHDRRTRRTTVLTEAWGLSANDWTLSRRRVYCTADVEGRTAIFGMGRGKGTPTELVRGAGLGPLRFAGRRLFTTESSLKAPDEVYSFDAAGADRRRETHFTRAWLRKHRLGRTKSVVFRGAGDEPVQMHVVFPPGGAAAKGAKRRKKPPLVHLIHGGPHGAFEDSWHWRWNAQVFAARGFVAALVNFHGSTGWGQEFTSSIVGEWGDKPYEDILRATDHLVDAGLVDGKRVAATGGSYGGYLASWIAARTDRFACIVNHAGVCDLQMEFASDIPQGWHLSAGGDLWSDLAGLDRFNPIRNAEGFASPMLILHGEKDYRVPYSMALQIYNVYRARGLPARLVCYPEENHWILKPRESVHWYGEFLAWLDRWLGRRRKRKG